MSEEGHFRPTLRASPVVRCLLFPESDLLTARQPNGAKGQLRKWSYLRWSFGQPGSPQPFLVLRYVFSMPIRAKQGPEIGDT